MNDVKVGDKVRRTAMSHSLEIGEVYTVAQVRAEGLYIKLVERPGGTWLSRNFEMVAASPVQSAPISISVMPDANGPLLTVTGTVDEVVGYVLRQPSKVQRKVLTDLLQRRVA